MLAAADIVQAAERKWPAVLRAEAQGENLFPLKIPFGRPRPTDDFALLQRDIEALAAAPIPWRIDWEEIQTRKWGRQRWPLRVAFDSAETLAAALNRSHQRLVDHLKHWRSLVDVCRYFDEHPQPFCFPRQIPISVGTKFIEEHSGILRELLDVVLTDRIDRNATTFAERFNMLIEPAQVRFSFLDSALQALVQWPITECTIPLPAFADLSWKVPRVLVVENRDVFLCLPAIARTVAIFGAGKAAAVLPSCSWLMEADVVYWGDCDDAGYGILSALRSRLPHVRSVLMDDAAWTAWKHLAVPGRRDASVRHAHLTVSERLAHDAVLAGPWMLEQERIPPVEAERALRAAFA